MGNHLLVIDKEIFWTHLNEKLCLTATEANVILSALGDAQVHQAESFDGANLVKGPLLKTRDHLKGSMR